VRTFVLIVLTAVLIAFVDDFERLARDYETVHADQLKK
jgi:hypothetical protein